MLSRKREGTLVAGVLGLAGLLGLPGLLGLGLASLGGCGSSSTPAGKLPTDTESTEQASKPPDKNTDEALAAEIAKEQGESDKAEAPSTEDTAPKTDPKRKEEIYKLVKERRPKVLECVKEARKKNRKLGTDLVISFELNSDGTFKQPPTVVKERSDISDPKVVSCAIDTIKSIKFPPHPKGMESTFTYPYKFDVVRTTQ